MGRLVGATEVGRGPTIVSAAAAAAAVAAAAAAAGVSKGTFLAAAKEAAKAAAKAAEQAREVCDGTALALAAAAGTADLVRGDVATYCVASRPQLMCAPCK